MATNEGGCEFEKKIMREDKEMLTYNTFRLVFFVSSFLILDGMMVAYGCNQSIQRALSDLLSAGNLKLGRIMVTVARATFSF